MGVLQCQHGHGEQRGIGGACRTDGGVPLGVPLRLPRAARCVLRVTL
jgi:hypothetical protein